MTSIRTLTMNNVNSKEFLYDFVQKGFPYPKTQFHTLWEARSTLSDWVNKFPDLVPSDLKPENVYKAYVLNRADYTYVDPLIAWIVSNEVVCWEQKDIEYALCVEPDGVYVKHRGLNPGDCWTEWERAGD